MRKSIYPIRIYQHRVPHQSQKGQAMKSIRTIFGIFLLLVAALLWDLTKLHVTSYLIGSVGFMIFSFAFLSVEE